jgi:hypothetical protein
MHLLKCMGPVEEGTLSRVLLNMELGVKILLEKAPLRLVLPC